ncbi:MAG: ComEC/Rec2 family competence protein [Sphaerobacter sp.]|nr:ComEC/Rec2 family competence protein [Sphaerobacter sp.]
MSRSRARLLRGFALGLLLVLLVVAGALALRGRSTPDAPVTGGGLTRVAFFDVGQGLAVGIITADGHSLLYDTGDQVEAIDAVVLPFFHRYGVERLDYLVISHPDQDHIGELATVLERIPVSTYVDPAIESTNRAYLRGLRLVEQQGIPARRARRGDVLELGTRTRAEILWPRDPLITDGDGTVIDNDNSVVLRVTDGNVRILLTGDLEEEAEHALVELDRAALRADILQVAHHGSRSSSSAPFLDAVDGEDAIISVGADNRYGHPHPETVQRLRAAGLTISRTDVDGTVVVVSDGSGYHLEREEAAP